jgi:hypothetical protein
VADARDVMRLHAEALFTHDRAGDLVRVNEPNGAVAPRFFLGRTTHGDMWRFRHDVASDVRAELEAAIRAELREGSAVESPIDPARYEAILARSAPVERTEVGPAFVFPDSLPRTANATGATRVTDANAELLTLHLAPWLPDVRLSQPMFVVTCDGHAVSVCASVRQAAEAYEAGVETAAVYRGRGLAAPAVAAWATAVRALGRVPLYSTSWQNTASRAVARKLALIHFGNDLHIT